MDWTWVTTPPTCRRRIIHSIKASILICLSTSGLQGAETIAATGRVLACTLDSPSCQLQDSINVFIKYLLKWQQEAKKNLNMLLRRGKHQIVVHVNKVFIVFQLSLTWITWLSRCCFSISTLAEADSSTISKSCTGYQHMWIHTAKIHKSIQCKSILNLKTQVKVTFFFFKPIA